MLVGCVSFASDQIGVSRVLGLVHLKLIQSSLVRCCRLRNLLALLVGVRYRLVKAVFS
jgi:hypothetical protein